MRWVRRYGPRSHQPDLVAFGRTVGAARPGGEASSAAPRARRAPAGAQLAASAASLPPSSARRCAVRPARAPPARRTVGREAPRAAGALTRPSLASPPSSRAEDARAAPIALDRALGECQHVGDLGVGEAGEEAQRDDLRQPRVLRSSCASAGSMASSSSTAPGVAVGIRESTRRSSPPRLPVTGAGVVDHHLTHDARRQRQKCSSPCQRGCAPAS